MTRITSPLPFACLCGLTLALGVAGANAATIVIDWRATVHGGIRTNNGQLGAAGGGQSFTPNTATGYAAEPTLYLTGMTFFRGNGGITTTQVSGTTYLAIYAGNPDSNIQVGASSNSLAIGINDAEHTAYNWTFNHLALNPGTQYWAVFSNSPLDNNVLQPTGTWLQMSLETVSNSYTGGSAIIANRDAHSSGTDTSFMVSFDTVPEPGVSLLGVLGCLGLLRRRR